MLNKVLISCSFAPQARDTIALGIAFAKSIGAQMHFCHVSEDDINIRQRMQILLEDLGVKDPLLTLKPGSPDKVIRRMAKDIKADLIIAGALEHEGSIVGILGSVARRLVRKAHCSVLLLTGLPKSDAQLFKNIVVSVDYDWCSREMCSMVAQMARIWDAEVHMVHTYEFSLRYLQSEEVGDPKRIAHYEEESEAEECQKLNDFAEKGNWQGIELRCECLKHDGSELTEYAARVDADLVVMPSPLRIEFWERFFNPPAEIALQDLPCSMLFYREKKA